MRFTSIQLQQNVTAAGTETTQGIFQCGDGSEGKEMGGVGQRVGEGRGGGRGRGGKRKEEKL